MNAADSTGPAAPAASADRTCIDAAALERVLALCAALLLGAGLIFWIAANWQEQTRQFKYHLLQAAVLAPALAALWPKTRTPALLLATLALGGLLAFVGQTYQTGADPWQLFAAWAALSLPWALLGRDDWLWSLWLLVAATALGLWSGMRLLAPFASSGPVAALADLAASFCWLLLAALPPVLVRLRLVASPARRRPAAFSRRIAAGLAVVAWTAHAVWWLFAPHGDDATGINLHYVLNLLLILLAGLFAWRSKPRDFVVLAGVLLALNVLFLSTVFKWLFLHARLGDMSGALLLFAVAAAASVGGSSVWLYRAQQRAAPTAPPVEEKTP